MINNKECISNPSLYIEEVPLVIGCIHFMLTLYCKEMRNHHVMKWCSALKAWNAGEPHGTHIRHDMHGLAISKRHNRWKSMNITCNGCLWTAYQGLIGHAYNMACLQWAWIAYYMNWMFEYSTLSAWFEFNTQSFPHSLQVSTYVEVVLGSIHGQLHSSW